jgi:hypothetical protein
VSTITAQTGGIAARCRTVSDRPHFTLEVPSGESSGIKLHTPFIIATQLDQMMAGTLPHSGLIAFADHLSNEEIEAKVKEGLPELETVLVLTDEESKRFARIKAEQGDSDVDILRPYTSG